ncbi:MAG: type VI secretion system tube protein Hcp [Ferruginibacter sp.]
MRTMILLALLLPLSLAAQKTDVFLKLIDAGGQQIKGDATPKGYERSIAVISFASSGKNNVQLSFTMNPGAAAADLKRAMGNSSFLQSGVLTVTQINPGGGMPLVSYTIKMENIRVNSCAEALGCNGVITTTTVLTATRIGWTYYQTDLKSGAQSVSRKYGYDGDTGREWTNF